MKLVEEAAAQTGIGRACNAVSLSRAMFYRLRGALPPEDSSPVTHAFRGRDLSLTLAQEEEILAALNSDRFLDCAPHQVWATLMDEGRYLCS